MGDDNIMIKFNFNFIGNSKLHCIKDPREVEPLLEKGESLTKKNRAGQTPFDTCSNAAVAREFVKAIDEDNLLELFTETGPTNIFHTVQNVKAAEVYYNKIKEILLNIGKSEEEAENQLKDLINTQDHKGDTPLHCACRHHNAELTKFLVQKGGNLLIRNNKGFVPFREYRKGRISEQDLDLLDELMDMSQLSNTEKGELVEEIVLLI